MNSVDYFEVKISYTKEKEDGTLNRVTEPFLFDATSFTEAESFAVDKICSTIKGEYTIKAITRKNYTDIFKYDDSETWFECRLKYVTSDMDTGKEKSVKNNFLITASSVKQADERIHESLSDMMVSFEIIKINKTPIVEVFPYTPSLDREISRTPAKEQG